jgi:hypothetical protein
MLLTVATGSLQVLHAPIIVTHVVVAFKLAFSQLHRHPCRSAHPSSSYQQDLSRDEKGENRGAD